MATALRAAAAGRGTVGATLSQTLEQVFETLAAWHQRAATRHELARLDERMLHDIGLSPADAEREIGKPFWQA